MYTTKDANFLPVNYRYFPQNISTFLLQWFLGKVWKFL